MRQHQRVLPQDPSLSPTFALSQPTNSVALTVPQPLRRNLFASHLSRRPVSSQQPQSPAAPNVSTDRMIDPFSIQSHSYPAASPTHEQPQRRTYHPESLTHELPGRSQHGTESHGLSSRSTSPAKTQLSQQPTSIGNIVTLDPATGRPAIPVIPRLPRRLRIDDDEDNNQQDDYHETDDWDLPRLNQADLKRQSSSLIASDSQRQRLHELIDGAHANDYRDFERIERVLSEMQSQQRARARHIEPVPDTPLVSSMSARTKGKARAVTRSQDTAPNLHGSQHRQTELGGGGIGAMIEPAEKEELLSLITSSLARKVHTADRENWMFGVPDTGQHLDSFHDEIEM